MKTRSFRCKDRTATGVKRAHSNADTSLPELRLFGGICGHSTISTNMLEVDRECMYKVLSTIPATTTRTYSLPESSQQLKVKRRPTCHYLVYSCLLPITILSIESPFLSLAQFLDFPRLWKNHPPCLLLPLHLQKVLSQLCLGCGFLAESCWYILCSRPRDDEFRLPTR